MKYIFHALIMQYALNMLLLENDLTNRHWHTKKKLCVGEIKKQKHRFAEIEKKGRNRDRRMSF